MGCMQFHEKQKSVFRVRLNSSKPTVVLNDVDLEQDLEETASNIKVPKSKKPQLISTCYNPKKTTFSKIKRKLNCVRSMKNLKGSSFKFLESSKEIVEQKSGQKYWNENSKKKIGYQVIKVFDDGAILEGVLKDSRVYGKLTVRNNIVYEGQFLGRAMDGFGRVTLPNGDIYEANWQNGKMDPNVKIKYANGNSFDGTIINHKKNGYGVFYWADGRKYQGCWKDGMMSGVGKLYRRGSQLVGQWKNNELSVIISEKIENHPELTFQTSCQLR